MMIRPNYARYDPGGGFRAPPESGVVCALCCYDIGSEEEIDFWCGQVCHAQCLAERRRKDVENDEQQNQ